MFRGYYPLFSLIFFLCFLLSVSVWPQTKFPETVLNASCVGNLQGDVGGGGRSPNHYCLEGNAQMKSPTVHNPQDFRSHATKQYVHFRMLAMPTNTRAGEGGWPGGRMGGFFLWPNKGHQLVEDQKVSPEAVTISPSWMEFLFQANNNK